MKTSVGSVEFSEMIESAVDAAMRHLLGERATTKPEEILVGKPGAAEKPCLYRSRQWIGYAKRVSRASCWIVEFPSNGPVSHIEGEKGKHIISTPVGRSGGGGRFSECGA